MILFSHMTDQLHSVINFNMVGKYQICILKVILYIVILHALSESGWKNVNNIE